VSKDDVKLLCETDDKLQWWAMVLFAEIVALVHSGYGKEDNTLAEYVRAKVEEFPRIIIQRQLEKAKPQPEEDKPCQTQ
jgi:hypothetical protein